MYFGRATQPTTILNGFRHMSMFGHVEASMTQVILHERTIENHRDEHGGNYNGIPY